MTGTPVWMGCECEYAVMGIRSAERGAFGHALLNYMKEHLESLPDCSLHGFMSPYGRCYMDGTHPEFSTVPCSNPWDLLDALHYLESLAVRCAGEYGNGLYLNRCNMDYLQKTTWGQHDCYTIEKASMANPMYVIPHLVSRSLFSGAGGFSINGSVPHVSFCLSPRAQYVTSVAGHMLLPIWQVKYESSLPARGRVHIMAGENLVSDLAIALKLGTTALVIRLAAEDSRVFEKMPVLADPVNALKDISNKWWLRRSCPVRTMAGGWIEAIEIQRFYAELVQGYADCPYLPAWSGWLAKMWLAVLESLEAGPSRAWNDLRRSGGTSAKNLDWVVKVEVFERVLKDNGGYALTDLTKQKVPLQLVYKLLRVDTDWGRLTDDGPGEQVPRQRHTRLPRNLTRDSVSFPFYPARGESKARSDAIRSGSFDHNHVCSWHAIRDRRTGEVVRRFTESGESLSADMQVQGIIRNIERYAAEA